MRTSFVIAALIACSACDNQPAEGKPRAAVQEAPQAQEIKEPTHPQPSAAGRNAFEFSQAGSKIEFTGAKVTGKNDGSFKRFSGTITMADETAATGGSVNVEIEIDSLSTDVERLTNHLKSPELLDAAQFPKARFDSTSVTHEKEAYTVTGNFELHGVRKQISFPANIRVQGDQVEADAEFAINRKDFNITYPGKPDDLIKDDVLIKLTIRAQRLR